MQFAGLAFVTLAFALLPVASAAQAMNEMTVGEMTQAFNNQKTRGLVLIPSGEDTGNNAASTAEISSADSYSAVAAEDQVNVRIRFDFDSAALRHDQLPKLATVCEAMKLVDVSTFQIVGHTDASGNDEYNRNLSQLRAEEVKRRLTASCGIDPRRLHAIGMGESVLFDRDDPNGAVNRRVEFQALG